jgi:hypothetical protein
VRDWVSAWSFSGTEPVLVVETANCQLPSLSALQGQTDSVINPAQHLPGSSAGCHKRLGAGAEVLPQKARGTWVLLDCVQPRCALGNVHAPTTPVSSGRG